MSVWRVALTPCSSPILLSRNHSFSQGVGKLSAEKDRFWVCLKNWGTSQIGRFPQLKKGTAAFSALRWIPKAFKRIQKRSNDVTVSGACKPCVYPLSLRATSLELHSFAGVPGASTEHSPTFEAGNWLMAAPIHENSPGLEGNSWP